MLKKIIYILLFSFLLTSCGSDGESSTEASGGGLDLHESDYFSIFIPSKWQIIDDKSNIIPKPSTGNIVLAVTKNSVGTFSNNLLILSDKLPTGISSGEYSTSNNLGSKSSYYQYNLLQEKNIEFSQGYISKLYIFESRYGENTPKVNFLQTAIVCPDNTGYLLTIGLTKDETNFVKYENILKTFECKN